MTKTFTIRVVDRRVLTLNPKVLDKGAKTARTLAIQSGCTARIDVGMFSLVVRLAGKENAVRTTLEAFSDVFSIAPFTVNKTPWENMYV